MIQLSGFQSDALREIGGIGMGNATTALSQLLSSRVQLNLSNSQIMDIASMASMMPSSMTLVAIMMDLTGDLTGTMMMLLDPGSAVTLCSNLLREHALEENPEIYESALSETVNILAGSYLNNICEFLGTRVLHSTPEIVLEDAETVFSRIKDRSDATSSEVLNIETMFQVQGLCNAQGNCTLYGDMFVFLDEESVGALLILIEKLLDGRWEIRK